MKTTTQLPTLNLTRNHNHNHPALGIEIKKNIRIKNAVASAALLALLATTGFAAEISLESAPPVVVKTVPVAGATDVDSALTEIKVTYSKAMQDGSWSWSTWGEENYPETTGKPRYLSDRRTCVLPVKLQPGKLYALWLNSDKFKNFTDVSGRAAVPYLLTFTTAGGGSGGGLVERTVNRLVSEFPAGRDLATPEGACVAWQRATAAKDAKANSLLSLIPIDPKEQKEWFEREGKRDPEGLTTYLNAIADSKIILVQTWRDELANVITYLPFPEGKGRSPYSSRTFGCVNGEWKNLGEDRLPDLATAKANFERKKENLWAHFQGLRSASKSQVTGDNVVVEDLALRILAAIRDKEDNVLKDLAVDRIKGWRDALPQFAFELRERVQQGTGKPFALKVGESLVDGDYAAVKCTGSAELEGKYLVLFFAKAENGWRNCSLRNSPSGTPLSKHLADCVAEMQKLNNTAGKAGDEQLNDDQRAVLAWTDRQFKSYFDNRTFDGWSEEERGTLERKLIDALNGPRSTEYYQAIGTLAALRSTKGLPRLREIAFERVDRNNRDRWMCIRALGLIGDKESVPELVHLVYHGNQNTHWWAQISLVRLTGQNFGGDWNAWGKWWNDHRGEPPYKSEIIRWWEGQPEPDQLATSLAESDRKFLTEIKPK